MRSRNIRTLVVLAILACAGIIITQVYWVRKAYALNEQRFNANVNIALKNVVAELARERGAVSLRANPVVRISPGCYSVLVNSDLSKEELQERLVGALTAQNIITDFQFGLSEPSGKNGFQYAGYYHSGSSGENPEPMHSHDGLQRSQRFFAICFPNMRQYLLSELTIWGVSSGLLILIIGFLGYLIWVIFRQRQLSEVHKDFISNMTHEFKTPLASIRLSADVLKNPGILSQPQRLLNYATIISNEAMQLTTQVDRILQMSKAESDGLQLERKEFVWQELLRQQMPHYARLANVRQGVVSMQLPDRPIIFNGDIVHITNALNNLVDNAIKYSLDPPKVQIALTINESQVVIQVTDNGIGIDKTRQKMLFDKFYRVHTGNVHDVKGFGIGLNYVRIIARAHGGDVSCASQLGKGSIFTLIFPLT